MLAARLDVQIEWGRWDVHSRCCHPFLRIRRQVDIEIKDSCWLIGFKRMRTLDAVAPLYLAVRSYASVLMKASLGTITRHRARALVCVNVRNDSRDVDISAQVLPSI